MKKNDFKVDVLAQNRSGKRKRGKLNLEKAMAKNIFDNEIVTSDPSSKRLNNLFDTFNALKSSDHDSPNLHKLSKKSVNSGEGSKTGEVIFKEVHWDPSLIRVQLF